MLRIAHYWLGFVVFCVAAVFAVGLGSFLQYRAIARQQAASTAYSEAFTASVVPPPAYRRAVSF